MTLQQKPRRESRGVRGPIVLVILLTGTITTGYMIYALLRAAG